MKHLLLLLRCNYPHACCCWYNCNRMYSVSFSDERMMIFYNSHICWHNAQRRCWSSRHSVYVRQFLSKSVTAVVHIVLFWAHVIRFPLQHSSLCIRLFAADTANHQLHPGETPFQIIPLNPPAQPMLVQSAGTIRASNNSDPLSSQLSVASSASQPSQSQSSNSPPTTSTPNSSNTTAIQVAQNTTSHFANGGAAGDSCSSAGSSSRLSVVSLNASFANASSAGDRSSTASSSASPKHGSSSTSSDHTLVQSHGGLDDSISGSSQHSESSQHAVINLGEQNTIYNI